MKVVLCVSAAILSLWLSAKFFLFRGLEYTSDLFTHLEMSRSLFRGYPFLADNQFGSHLGLHNFFVVPLLYPLTGPFGAYGLFLSFALLTFAAALLIAVGIGRGEPGQQERIWLVLGAGLLGPISFWVFDDPIYGWHAELLYVPLGVLFALALLRRSRLAWLWGGLIALTREDGAVLAWAIQALYLLSKNPWTRTRWRELAAITAGWLLVFAAGMAVLIANGATSGRLGTVPAAIRTVIDDPGARAGLIASAGDAAALAVCGAVLWIAGLSPLALLLCIGASLVVSVPLALGGALYPGIALRAHGLGWPARFATLWSVWLAAVVFASIRPGAEPHRSRRAWIAAVAILSVLMQAITLRWRRDYDFLARLTPAWRGRPAVVADALSPGERQFVRCLGLRLPRESPVATDGSLFAPFHQHDVVWPDRAFRAWRKPDLVLCDEARRLPFAYGCLDYEKTLAPAYADLAFDRLSVRYLPVARAAVAGCSDRVAHRGP
jgi:hypothetical protein